MTNPSRPFEGQVALLTGAAGRIAATTALLLAARGARIAAVDRPGADFSVLRDELPATELLTLEADVRDAAQVDAAVAATLARFGQIDIFFNAAGIGGPVRPIVDYPLDDFNRVIDVNVKGVFHGLRSVLPPMIARGRGVIINACSLAGLRGSKGISAYAASKHAVVGLTKVAANENAGKGIRVNAIAPGPIEGPMLDQHFAEKGDIAAVSAGTAAAIPQGRIGTADDVARLVAFLASPESDYINGAIVPIDGALGAG